MTRDGIPKLRHDDILTYEEILRIAGIAVSLGVRKIRVTGGEPLVRKGLCDFLSRLTAMDGIEDVSLTTNGISLVEKAERIWKAGIRRVNVSLDTLRRDRYETITGHDGLARVQEGIALAGALGFDPIKINVVLIRGLNDDEILDFGRMSMAHPYPIRFIEYMPVGISASCATLRYVSNQEVKERLGALGELRPIPRGDNDGPSERFKFPGARGEIGFISPLSHHFCAQCNRLRLTASGHLRPCLLSDLELDLIGPMRRGVPDEALREVFLESCRLKPEAHRIAPQNRFFPSAQMSAIGG
jgi:cyclic pyranopterin phosphate synthase